jgi:hypothetical protein
MWISTVLVVISEKTVMVEQIELGQERNRRSGSWLESQYILT